MISSHTRLKVKIFADGADLNSILRLAEEPYIGGFTTNPTLMRKAGVTHYETFAREVLSHIKDRPISFEVLSDDFATMEEQALKIADWGANVYVKIPITTTHAQSSAPMIRRLAKKGVKVNVTAMTTIEHVHLVLPELTKETPSCISLFAGRVADTGRDPVALMQQTLQLIARNPSIELIWASPREVLNVVQADKIGCHIITVTPDILKKLPMLGRDLNTVSLDTVKMFHDDATTAGFTI